MVLTRRARSIASPDKIVSTKKSPMGQIIKGQEKNPSPIKKLVLKKSPGRTTYSSTLRTPGKKIEDANAREDESQDSAIEIESLQSSIEDVTITCTTKKRRSAKPPPLALSPEAPSTSSGSSAYGSARKEDFVTPAVSPSLQDESNPEVEPLKGREREFDSLVSLIDGSIERKTPLTVYISGTPGTGKSATTRLILQRIGQAPRKIKSVMVNCTSLRTANDICSSVMKNVGKPCSANAAPRVFREFVAGLKKCFVIVLDEADFVSASGLSYVLTMPSVVSHHLIVIGIANTIDFTERVLRKIKLKNEPHLMVFGRYSREQLVTILKDKLSEEQSEEGEEEAMDTKALALCANKVAAVSGDLRMAMDLMRQSTKKIHQERTTLREKAMQVARERREGKAENMEPPAPSTPSAVPSSTPLITEKDRFKAVVDVYNTVYASPLARAKLPLQPKVLLAVCMKLSAGKKKALTRSALFSAYHRACTLTGWPRAEGDDLDSAFDLITSQSFISCTGDAIRMQVDVATVQKVCDMEVINKIKDLKL